MELDDVTSVHNRWSLTRINFSSYKISIVISIVFSIIIIILFHLYLIHSTFEKIFIHIALGVASLILTDLLDFILLRGNPINKLSKIFHLSAFSMILWSSMIIFGIVSDMIFNKNIPVYAYILEGFFLSSGLRIGLFSSVFGVKLWKAIILSFIQPGFFFISFVPSQYIIEIMTNKYGLIFGIIITSIGITWVILTDRMGRPKINSTFGLLQAFLDSWTEKKNDKIEKIFESKSMCSEIETKVIKFKRDLDEIFLVLPQIHPGPFMSVGGSDLSSRLYDYFSKKAMIFHSVSDHSLNIPSKIELNKYIDSIKKWDILYEGDTCSIPLQVRDGNVIVTGILFGKTPLIMLSNSPKGMEDLPLEIGSEIEIYSKKLGFDDIFLIDSHNSMGGVLNFDDRKSMLDCAKKCLELMRNSDQHQFCIGYSNSENIKKLNNYQELGKSGLNVLIIKINDKKYEFGWIDSNNMVKGMRENLIDSRKIKGDNILEICTSDTHETSGKRTNQGYYPFGYSIDSHKIEEVYDHMIDKAVKDTTRSRFQMIRIRSQVKLMGHDQFSDYSKALNKSMNFTKICLGVTFGFIIIMLMISR